MACLFILLKCLFSACFGNAYTKVSFYEWKFSIFIKRFISLFFFLISILMAFWNHCLLQNHDDILLHYLLEALLFWLLWLWYLELILWMMGVEVKFHCFFSICIPKWCNIIYWKDHLFFTVLGLFLDSIWFTWSVYLWSNITLLNHWSFIINLHIWSVR